MTLTATVRKTLDTAARLLPAVLLLALLTAACDKGRKVDVAAGINPNKMPTMTTKNVATFISDSGIVMYKIVAPVWYVYDNTDTPCWKFPKSVYLQKFNDKYQPVSSVAADSAIYFKDRHLWRLNGNVEIRRMPADLFLTQQLFWNEREHRLYSDSFIHVQTQTQMLEGYGFVANDRLTEYMVRRPSGMFPAPDFSQMQSAPNPNAGSSADAPRPPSAPKSLPGEESSPQD